MTAVKEQKWTGVTIHSMRGNWCRDFVAGCPSCGQPVLKTSNGPHPFFNDQQTLEERTSLLFTSALRRVAAWVSGNALVLINVQLLYAGHG